MAALIRLKDEVEEVRGSYMRMVFSRATEAHLLADEIGMSLVVEPHRLESITHGAARSAGEDWRHLEPIAAIPLVLGRASSVGARRVLYQYARLTI